jgi:hypothetical protein
MEAMEYLVEKKKEAYAEKESKKEERCKKAFALQEERIRIEREKGHDEKENERRSDNIYGLEYFVLQATTIFQKALG